MKIAIKMVCRCCGTYLCVLMADIRGDGEAGGRHAGDDLVQHARTTHGTYHKISHLSGFCSFIGVWCYLLFTVTDQVVYPIPHTPL